MVKFKEQLLAGVILCTILGVTSGRVINGNEEHDTFFHSLTEHEKQALMALAVSHYNVDTNGNSSSTFPVVPIRPSADEIPRTLFTTMMNGGVPKMWMQEFINWLRQSYGMTNKSFQRFLEEEQEQLCASDDGIDCIPMKVFQKDCCPFG